MRSRFRPLSEGEVALVVRLFGDAIDVRRVRVYRRRYMPFQPRNCAMTPNGSLYFHASCFLDDYACGDPRMAHWFMHEMVHVWQHQLGYPVRLRGAVRIGLSYSYTLHESANLADYNMEAQGEVLADYFVLKHLQRPDAMHQRRYRDSLALFEHVLGRFLVDPRDRQCLPRGPARWLAGFLQPA